MHMYMYMYMYIHAIYNKALIDQHNNVSNCQIVLFQHFKVAHVRTEEQQAEISLRIFLFALFARVFLLRRVQQVVVLVEVELLHQFLLLKST